MRYFYSAYVTGPGVRLPQMPAQHLEVNLSCDTEYSSRKTNVWNTHRCYTHAQRTERLHQETESLQMISTWTRDCSCTK